MKSKIFVIALACLLGLSLSAQSTTATAKVGLAGAQFLKIPIGGRATALDAAVMPLASGASAVFSNPAGLNHITSTNSAFVATSVWFADITLNSGSYVRNFEGRGKVAVFFSQMNSGDMPITTVDDQTGENSGTFTSVSSVVGISGAKMFTDRFGVGLTTKIVTENMANGVGGDDFGKGSVLAIDIGTWYDTGIKGVKISAVVQNFGPEITPQGIYYDYDRGDTITVSVPGDIYGTKDEIAQEFSFRPYSLPMVFNFGVAFSPMDNLDVSFTTVQPNDNLQRYLVGVEYSLMGMAAFRGSYAFGGYPFMTGIDEDNNDESLYEDTFFGYDDRTFSGGLGLKFGKIGLDLAYIHHTFLDPVYNGSVNFSF